MAATEMEILAAGLGAITGLNIVPPGYSQRSVQLEGGAGPLVKANVLDLDALHKHTLQWWTGGEEQSPVLEALNSLKINFSIAVGKKETESVRLHVVTLTGRRIELSVSKDCTIGNFKKQIQTHLEMHPDQQRLIHKGKVLQDDDTSLRDFDAVDGDTVHIVHRLRGGADPYEISSSLFDPKFDCNFTSVTGGSSENYVRGDKNYIRPYGWNRKALNVKDKYDNNKWLGGAELVNRQESKTGEWPNSYHGTDKEAAKKIADEGYKVGPRQLYGKGVYSTPFPNIAESYATKFECKGKWYKIIFQNRVDLRDGRTKEVNGNKYFVTQNEKDIRPYSILYKEA